MYYHSVIENQVAIVVQGTINNSLSAVWKAWTEAEGFKKWWGPFGYSCNYCDIDFRIGGKYTNSIQNLDGNEIWSTGSYKEIIPHRRIVFSDSFADSEGNIVPASFYKMKGNWALELITTVVLQDFNGSTSITFTQTGIPDEISDECMRGWKSSFYKLENILKEQS